MFSLSVLTHWIQDSVDLKKRCAQSLMLGLVSVILSACVPQHHRLSHEQDALIVNDITQLNPIRVRTVSTPTQINEIINAVKNHPGPISIGGGRYSMGGQIATDDALHIDMRHFNKIVSFDPVKKEITVQAGATWRQIQASIDPYDLSVSIMQSYANFTVGGSLSVNVHGRYVGQGAIIHSVKAIQLVLANGNVITATPNINSDYFNAAIGGYGAIGVITQATLALSDNSKLERTSVVMPASEYPQYFSQKIRNNPDVIFHNADLYPDRYDKLRAISFSVTDKSLTITDRLRQASAQSSYRDQLAVRLLAGSSMGKTIRQFIVDPFRYQKNTVLWRNYEASHNVQTLEPASRTDATYVLQEYFIPVEKFTEFYQSMQAILKRHDVNVLNISIRHAPADRQSLLSWGNTEVFSFVLYYRQGTDDVAKQEVVNWTRALIDGALDVKGSYYLPYQILATKEQFFKAYPRAHEFMQFKQKVDPTHKFRNRLIDQYFEPMGYESSGKR